MNAKTLKIIMSVVILVAISRVYGNPDVPLDEGGRKVILLNGTWQISEGGLEIVPVKFDRNVIVPGLVDMATPSFIEPGPKVANPVIYSQKDPRRDAFWYKRTFNISGSIPAVARLKISKAMYGTRVILNGKVLGEHMPCFTPGWFDAKDALRSGENELIVRVGADRDAVAGRAVSGMDKERLRYIPGIYDDVELILSGSPHIINVQAVPNIDQKTVTVHSWVHCTPAHSDINLHIIVREAKSHKIVGESDCKIPDNKSMADQTGNVTIPIRECRLWSPEDPFLYELEVRSTADTYITRFGMRSFRLDPQTGHAVLNGKPYFMRGSSITIHRIFEDSIRGYLPWNEEWVRKLHKSFRDMHWNSLRYCIGLAPEAWYRIADEEGFLIQDEFPIWDPVSKSELFKSDQLTTEYTEWLRERWNHPCVVLWDACNETYTEETGKAIQKVRDLDLSRRPWDNGWGEPVDIGDADEVHPYHFIFGPIWNFRLRDLEQDPANKAGLLIAQPFAAEKLIRRNPVIINEYGGLWLNRDGQPTKLTKRIYDYLLGPSSTVEQRRLLYARTMAALTEFFRAHRLAAGVLYYGAVDYSHSDGYTSDNWANVEKLIWNPDFYTYVRDAFAPVGLMLDVWAEEFKAGNSQEFPIVLINDLNAMWKGDVRFRITRNGKTLIEKTMPAEVAGLGTTRLKFTANIPEEEGNYQVEATLLVTNAGQVRSLRDFSVKTSH